MTNGNAKLVNDLGKKLLDAARIGNSNEVSELMKNGAPLTTDWLGTTPLHLAAIYGHTKTAEVLIKSGISRDGRTKVDKVPLHFACQHGHLEIVKLLVNNGAHVNATDMLKMTPLHWAVEANSFEICIFLLKSGAQTTSKNKFGKTALKIAQDKNYSSLVKLISSNEFKALQNLDVLRSSINKDHVMSSVKICRPEKFFTSISSSMMLKKQKSKRPPPIIPARWPSSESPGQERQYSSDLKAAQKMRLNAKDNRRAASVKYNVCDSVPVFNPITSKNKMKPLLPSQSAHEKATVFASYPEGSPLQKLQEAVRRQGMESRESTETSLSKTTLTESNATQPPSISFPVISLEYPSSTSANLHQGIPVISSKTLENLPENVKAIPLNLFDKEESLPSSTPSKLSNTSKTETVETQVNESKLDFDQTSKDTNDDLPIGIPINFLHQMFAGDIFMQAKSHNAKSYKKDKLLAINTEMGTIPILPVSGSGGFQLIPLDDEPPETSVKNGNVSKSESSPLRTTTKSDVGNNPLSSSGVISDNSNSFQPPVGITYSAAAAANLSMLAAHHGGFDTANAILNAQRQQLNQIFNSTANGLPIVSPQMIMSNGVIFQPAQAYQPATAQIYPTYVQLPPMIQPTHVAVQPSIIPAAIGHPPTFFASASAPSLFQNPSVFVPPSPVVHPAPVSPYVFLDANSLHRHLTPQTAPKVESGAATAQ